MKFDMNSRRVCANYLTGIWVALLLGANFTVSTARAEVPPTLESEYAELTYNFKSGNLAEALKLSEELMLKNPTVFEFQEVRALALKASGKTAEASKIYLELVKKRWKESKEKQDSAIIAPYYFELGNIRFQEKNNTDAEFYFSKAKEWNFNPIVASFYLGNIYTQTERWTDAEDQFQTVVASDVLDLKPTAHFMLAQVSFKLKSSNAGVRNLMWAKYLSQKEIDDPSAPESGKAIAKKILEASEKALAPIDKSGFTANLTFLLGYDSNVLSVPSSVASASTTNNGSVKATVMAGAGYATSPVETVQFAPSYRLSYNYNFNKLTRTGSFLANTATLYTNLFPIHKTSFGFKTEGTLTFQNQPDAITDKSVYRVYSLLGSFGPYLKQEFRNQWTASAEFFYQPSKVYGDKDLSEYQRTSGKDFPLKITAKQDRGSGAYNPGATLSLDWNRSVGSDNRAKSVGINLNNAVYLTEKIQLNPSFSLSQTLYNERESGLRRDKLMIFDCNANYLISEKISGMADLQYTKNFSNIEETYQYSKWQISAGANYSF